MPSNKPFRRRIVDRFHVISRAVKKFRKKPSGKREDEVKSVPAEPKNVSKSPSGAPVAVTEESSGEPVVVTEEPSGGPVAVTEEPSEGPVAILEAPTSGPQIEAADIVAMTDDEELRILSASGNEIHADWKDFIDHAVSENLITEPTIAPGNNVTCSSTRFFGCVFSTDSIQRSFEVPQIGDIEDSIVLGLQSVGPAGNSVLATALLATFGVDIGDLPEPIKTIAEILIDQVGGATKVFSIFNSDGLQNGSWIKALDAKTLEVTTALTWKLASGGVDLSAVQNSINDTAGLSLEAQDLQFSGANTPLLRLKHRAFISRKENGIFSTGSLYEILVKIPVLGFTINLKSRSGGSLSASIIRPVNGPGWASVARLLGGGLTEATVNPSESGILDNIELWKISIVLPNGINFDFSGISFMISFFVRFQLPGHPLTVGISYDTASGAFTGQLLVKSTYQNRLDPKFDELEDLPRGKWQTLPEPPDLRSAGPFSSLPAFVPRKLDSALITYRKSSQGTPYEFAFSASLVSDNSTSPGGNVPFPFDWSSLTLQYFRKGATSAGGDGVNVLSLNTSFLLDSVSGRFESGSLDMGFTYTTTSSGSTWVLAGSARLIQLGAIVEFLDPDLKGGILDVIGKLSLDALDVVYTYDSGSSATSPTATSFLFSGMISLGDLKLKLYYQYASKDTIAANKTAADQATGNPNLKPLKASEVGVNADSTWRFDAYLDVRGAGATIGTIADSIMDDASNSLPPFVRDIEIQPPEGSPDAHVISLHTGKATKKSGTITQEGVVFLLNVSISTVEFSFEQVSFPGAGQATNTKRLLRVSVGKLPLLSNLPVVKELPQPWSKLQYMWIPAEGFTRNEVSLLNEKLEVESLENKLFFKPATRDAADDNAFTDPVVLIGGHHFVVVVDNEAILDHVFDPGQNQQPSQPGQPGQPRQPTEGPPATSPQEKPPAKGAMTKQLGILDVSGLSLQYKNNHIYVFVDATLKLGPLMFSLIGFGIGLNVSNLKLNDLSALGDRSLGELIDFQLHGMEVTFDNPPILISGCFYHEIIQRGDQKIEAYRGGIAVAIPPYTFVAVGEYAQVEERGVKFKSVFVFAKLDGPIIDFQFAILRGLRIGFGYNSVVRSPAVEELFDFPLISNSASSGAGNRPMAILEKMSGGDNPWVQLKNEEYWLAFGFTISSFNLISATAVALVQFGNSGPVFRIFGDLTVSYPPDDVSATAKLFYIEVFMMAELNFAEDCFKIEAALAPSSFVFVPYCRLKGGLALYSFFGNSPYAGDWVFTVGGYHRAFQVPAHYPRAARLGLDFNISIISIRGECYFAITPKAIMTGALIRCELKIGPVFAWLDAAFDAIVQFSPLHYWVFMGVEVGVECRIKVLFCTIKIRICIGARLEIEGPDFGGSAYVDFWVFSFSFDFGKKVKGPPPISLSEFYTLCEKSGPPDESANSSATEGLVVQLKLSLEEGSFPMPSQDKEGQSNPDDTGAGTKWYVKGGNFQFRVSSVFALTEAYLETEESAQRNQSDGSTVLLGQQDTSLMQTVEPGTARAKLSSLPMDLSASVDPAGDGIKSKLCIAVQDVDPKGETVEDFRPSFVIKEMPLTLWADPKHPPDRLTQDKGTVPLPMAVTLSAPEPELAYANIPEFNATDMAKLCAGSNKVPDLPSPSQTDFLPEVLPTSSSTPTQKWADMQQTWTNASTQQLSLANDITALCMSQLGWDRPRPDIALKAEMTSTEPWKVPVAFPSRLVTGTGREAQGIEDGLDSFYLELPRTTIALVH